ncbi:hypothetical protein C0V75_09560 [Tabrizicola sp. TH137]|uniref:hypothetical protein n=1 Tax=Tabrizicola sp. TH137 TaxID=2067452 RepID=UPI000C7B3638|nr:hypothetical protein [Tabrizicola sp. TH137]PLL13593.1 hypothetical protein C0V75_09560 [Tabrizicola sp. TH137]
MTGPLLFPGRLPDGALVRGDTLPTQPTLRPSTPPAAPAPVWLSCNHAPETTPLHLWPASNGQAAASVPANDSGTARSASGALIFRAGENSGLCLADALPDAATASLGAIFRPAPAASAGTILSLQPQDGSGYLFLAHEDGQLRIGRKDADLSLTAPAPEGAILAGLSLAAGRVTLFVNGTAASSAPLALSGPADLFIGCRTARPGLKNKLGSFHLADVLLWPGDPAPDLAAACALRAERGQHGL